MPPARPSLALERRLLRGGASQVIGIDEVGRGSLAGPVTVGAAVVGATTPTAPKGLRDSKDLSAPRREALEPRIIRWAEASAVGHAGPAEIDVLGLTAALALAARRALDQLGVSGHVILDGSHNWLDGSAPGPVTMRVKADRHCSSVAAASVLAKVARDRIMCRLHGAGDRYDWAGNKGYAAPEHLAALATHGPSPDHRLSWQLPGVDAAALQRADPEGVRSRRRLEQGDQLVLIPEPASVPQR